MHVDRAWSQRLEHGPLDPRHQRFVNGWLLHHIITLQRLQSIHMLELPQPNSRILKVLRPLRNVNGMPHKLKVLLLTFDVILGIRAHRQRNTLCCGRKHTVGILLGLIAAAAERNFHSLAFAVIGTVGGETGSR